MAAQQTSAHYLPQNSKQLLRKHRAASLKTFQQPQRDHGSSVNAKSASDELRPHLLPIKCIQALQENKLPSDNVNSYVGLCLQIARLSCGTSRALQQPGTDPVGLDQALRPRCMQAAPRVMQGGWASVARTASPKQ